MKYEEALKRYVAKRWNYDVDNIKSVTAENDMRWGGYCETCEYQYSVVEFRVTFVNGGSKTHDEERDFASLLKDLIESGDE